MPSKSAEEEKLSQEIKNPLDYAALPSQKAFHDEKSVFKGFSGPVGSGKSQALCREALQLSMENPGGMGLLGAPTFPMLRAATQSTLFEILEESHIPFQFNKSENLMVFEEWGNSKILFRPVEEIERLRGTNLAWFGIDELTYTPEEAWLRLEARLRYPGAQRKCGFAAWTPKGYDWVYQKFVAETRHSNYVTIFAKPMENDFVGDDYYERLKNSYDEKFYRQEVLGEYLPVSTGLVYSSFARADHVTRLTFDPNAKILWSLDFNVDPMCSIVAQRKGDILNVLDEIFLHNAKTEDACREFVRRFPNLQGGLAIYGDASGSHEHTTSYSDYDMIRRHFESNTRTKPVIKVPKSNPRVRERINLTNAKLKSAAGDIEVFVDPKCKELIMDFEQVVYDKRSNEIDKTKDKNRTHLSDALGYLLWEEFRPKAPAGEQPGRLMYS